MRPEPKELYRAAIELAESGQPVFPCWSAGEEAKRPLTRSGFKNASTDRDVIRRWWKTHGSAAIGIPTGVAWDVLDVDTKNEVDGRVHLNRLKELGLLDGCKKVVHTPSGGWHLYFLASPGVTNKTSSSLGLDVRGAGGYVLAPPSYIETPHYAGGYETIGDTEGSTDEPIMWDLIVSAIEPIGADRKPLAVPQGEKPTSVASLREWVTHLRPGERNNGLHWAVCRCIENGIDPYELVEAALVAGLEEDEIVATIGSAMRRAKVRMEELKSEAEALFPDLD